MIKLSVIVPIYNVEAYLSECLASIFTQDIEDMEVIAIIDGSPDNSIAIAQEFAAQHPNMRIIEQENRGLSATRNRGIREAQGEYVCWIDSDDYYTPNALAEAYRLCVENDLDFIGMTFHQFPYVVEKMAPADGSVSPVMNGGEYMQYMAEHDLRYAWPSNYVHKRSFLLENNLFFLEGCVFEGSPHATRSASVAKRCMYRNSPLTQYRIREDSLSHSKKTPKVVHDIIRTLVYLIDTCEATDISAEYMPYFAKAVRNRALFCAKTWATLTLKEREDCKSMCTPRELLYFHAFVLPISYRNRLVRRRDQSIANLEEKVTALNETTNDLNKTIADLNKTVAAQQNEIKALTEEARQSANNRKENGIRLGKVLRKKLRRCKAYMRWICVRRKDH